MANHETSQWEQTVAFKQNASLATQTMRSATSPTMDEAEGIEIERMAELMMSEGVERRLAMRAAVKLFTDQKTRDLGLIGDASAGVLGADEAHQSAAVDGMRMVLVKIVQAPAPRFSAGCLMVALGMNHDSVASARQWATQQGKSHTQAANEVDSWSRLLSLPPTSARKTEEQKKIYRSTNGRTRREAK